MLSHTLLQPLILLSLTTSALASVVPTQHDAKLAKRDVNLQLLEFDELTLAGLTVDEIEQLFRYDMDGAIAFAAGALSALNQDDVESTPQFERWFGSGADTAEVNQVLGNSAPHISC